jgi:hypothetical protein
VFGEPFAGHFVDHVELLGREVVAPLARFRVGDVVVVQLGPQVPLRARGGVDRRGDGPGVLEAQGPGELVQELRRGLEVDRFEQVAGDPPNLGPQVVAQVVVARNQAREQRVLRAPWV